MSFEASIHTCLLATYGTKVCEVCTNCIIMLLESVLGPFSIELPIAEILSWKKNLWSLIFPDIDEDEVVRWPIKWMWKILNSDAILLRYLFYMNIYKNKPSKYN